MRVTIVSPLPHGKPPARFALAAALAVAVMVAAPCARAFTDTELKATRTVIANLDRGQWNDARQTAEKAHFPLLGKLIDWLDLTRPGAPADFGQLTRFIDQNQDWPMQGLLKRHAEEAIADGTPNAAIVGWFQRFPPISPIGAARYVDALIATGQRPQAEATARQFLIDGTMTPAQVVQFADRYPAILRPVDFQLRVDRLIWAGDTDSATPLMRFLSPEAKAIAQTRIAFAMQSPKAMAMLERLSDNQKNDLGILYDRMRYLRHQNKDSEAIALLEIAPPTLPHGNLWWNERAVLARRALESGNYKVAYALSRDHRQAEGAALADGEWLSGWIALRFLHDPKAAVTHFDRMLKTVSTPISVSRAAYWAGRADEAMGAPEAQSYFAKAANHIGTFYGQLAMAKITPAAKLQLPPQPAVAGLETRAFGNRELVQVALLFNVIGLSNRADPFIRRIGELARTPDDALLAMRLAKTNNSLAAEVSVAKKLMQSGVPLLADGYPFIEPLGPKAPESALIHAIIRQESQFDSGVQSPSGALGLMQLMPATARSVAARLKIKKHNNDLLTTDPRYNVTLGSAYLASLVEQYGGSYVMAIAAYNAGPGRVSGWIRDNGDPRRGNLEDMIDWIEKIDISETRNYVQRVVENLEIYRARMTRELVAPNKIAGDLVR